MNRERAPQPFEHDFPPEIREIANRPFGAYLFRIFAKQARDARSHEAIVKRFADLTEQEILALAISNEDEDSRIYRGFAEGLRDSFPASAKMLDEMAEEEVRHRTMLFELYRQKFGEYLPLIRRQDVKGFVSKRPLWLMRPLGLDEVRKYAANMEFETARFYRRAAETTRDASGRGPLVELAGGEEHH